jgi:hypothetical protein
LAELQHRFWALLSDLLGESDGAASADRDTDIVLDIVGRPIQLRLDERGQLHVSTMVFFNDSDSAQILREAIAEFNAVHLFAGGYCLLVNPESGSLYVDQIVSLHRFDGKSLRAFLIDFAHRATGCMRWYGQQLARQASIAA